MSITREQALALLQKYNKEPFHILHGLTVEGVMRWFAQDQGYESLFLPAEAAFAPDNFQNLFSFYSFFRSLFSLLPNGKLAKAENYQCKYHKTSHISHSCRKVQFSRNINHLSDTEHCKYRKKNTDKTFTCNHTGTE